ncbi:unnamed protein product [[Actinomadura] parvosata subsp. kistnae]|nr:unnamed protein product [Actinomadura parvosata subsp. kistnae]
MSAIGIPPCNGRDAPDWYTKPLNTHLAPKPDIPRIRVVI